METKRISFLPPKDALDEDALRIVKRLREHGHVAYLVGGGVRDLMLARRPKDFDIVSSAHPEEIRAIFRNSRIIGRRFRLVHIHFKDGKIIEVSTFRRPPLESLGQDLIIRSDNVFGTEAEDALRRDFTMNALFYDVETQTIIDYVGGIEDLEARRIRTIGEPVQRFREDPVRILRGIKFAARLEMQLDEATAVAAALVAPDLQLCAPSRLLEELLRILRAPRLSVALRLLHERSILPFLLPQHLDTNSWARIEALSRTDDEATLPDEVLLAAIYSPSVAQACQESLAQAKRPDVPLLVRDVLRPTAERLQLPKKLLDKIARLLHLRHGMLPRYRRSRPSKILAHDSYPLLLQLLQIGTTANDELDREVLHWLKTGANAANHTTLAPVGHSKKRRRRRRRGKNTTATEARPH